MSTTTKSNTAYQHARTEFHRLQELYYAEVTREFPVGTKVRWIHTHAGTGLAAEPVYREGVVIRPPAWGGRVGVQMRKGGPAHQIEGWRLDLVS